ncbi:hypothetical protein SAM23877_5927 [Streptomyces ambofaciens ATCC 23877]|uniref:Uncharacterized protein n=1 Tax=Streptomyces ambofaciens (strain ATCC 23877 / 3486 / DSM 40053 / JCM 4204 / NBRC 12836 / NRRL B-2516) TaxID=278992 RepID=A0A0K2B1I8_STRA7|nr:hypothetical protein SAM23877_5927 [Streptomyces ambofaciens ATCC 23877]
MTDGCRGFSRRPSSAEAPSCCCFRHPFVPRRFRGPLPNIGQDTTYARDASYGGER